MRDGIRRYFFCLALVVSTAANVWLCYELAWWQDRCVRAVQNHRQTIAENDRWLAINARLGERGKRP